MTYSAFSSIFDAFWAAPGPILTKSSKLLEVGIESLLAGCVNVLFSATNAVAVYWTAMNPLDNPACDPFPTRKGGRPLLNDGSKSAATLRSEMFERVDSARPTTSMAIDTGWP